MCLRSKRHIKKLRQLAKRSDVDLWFEDECHFQQHGSRCRMWVPCEDADPVVFHAPTRKSTGVFGAVRVEDGVFIAHNSEHFDAKTFHDFLRRLLRHRRHNRKMVVILDNVRWHHAKLLEPWLKKHRDQLNLDFLPPYSPELNNAERIWKLTRKLCTHNCYFETLDELEDVISDCFNKWRKPNDSLRKLCAVI